MIIQKLSVLNLTRNIIMSGQRAAVVSDRTFTDMLLLLVYLPKKLIVIVYTNQNPVSIFINKEISSKF